MRLVYTADLHGDITSYRQLFELAVQHAAGAIVVGGDLLPSHIKLEQAVQHQRDFIHDQLRPLLVEFHAAYPNCRVFLLAGNDDWAAAIVLLDDLEREGLVCPLHERVYALSDDLWLSGYACVPITPFSVKDFERLDGDNLPDYSLALAYTSTSGQPARISLAELARRPSIAEGLATLARQSTPARTIYACHAPPFNTGLDQTRQGHAGSRAVRDFIEQHQPLLTLHGHIHEAPYLSQRYAERLGQTWCVNPGHDQQRFHAVVLDTQDVTGTLWHTIFGPIKKGQL